MAGSEAREAGCQPSCGYWGTWLPAPPRESAGALNRALHRGPPDPRARDCVERPPQARMLVRNRTAHHLRIHRRDSRRIREITDDADVLLEFYNYPAEHWIHLRTTNPIESTFATVRLRTRVTKGAGSRAAGIAMSFKLLESAQRRWRIVNDPHLVALVRAEQSSATANSAAADQRRSALRRAAITDPLTPRDAQIVGREPTWPHQALRPHRRHPQPPAHLRTPPRWAIARPSPARRVCLQPRMGDLRVRGSRSACHRSSPPRPARLAAIAAATTAPRSSRVTRQVCRSRRVCGLSPRPAFPADPSPGRA